DKPDASQPAIERESHFLVEHQQFLLAYGIAEEIACSEAVFVDTANRARATHEESDRRDEFLPRQRSHETSACGRREDHPPPRPKVVGLRERPHIGDFGAER